MKRRKFRGLTALICLTLVFPQSGLAVESSYSLGADEFQKPLPTAQYIYSLSGRSNLVAVELLGAVNKPGIYYIPANTDLLKLLSLAGGTLRGADTEGILVRKTKPQDWGDRPKRYLSPRGHSFKVDIDSLISSGDPVQLGLGSNDFIYVPQDEPFISDDMFRTVSIMSLVIGSVLTAVLIADRSREN